MDEWMDGWMDGWMGGWMDGRVDELLFTSRKLCDQGLKGDERKCGGC